MRLTFITVVAVGILFILAHIADTLDAILKILEAAK
jgi:hypothetical protein